MSPHLYLLYFLICVEWSICYEYYGGNLNDKRDANNVIVKHERNFKIGKNPNAEFDLAGFLNFDDESATGDGISDYVEKSGLNSKGYLDYGSLSDNSLENINKREDTPDFGTYNPAKSEINPLELNNLDNSGQFNMVGLNTNEKFIRNRDDKAVTTKFHDDPSADTSLIHNPEKKCSFRKMKFPFFSLNKSQTTKKAKKRKMFCLNCKKDDSTTTTGRYEINNKIKRSYVERLCPECQKRFRAQLRDNFDDTRQLNQRMVHNSRQYFGEVDNLAKAKLELDNLLKDNLDETSTQAAATFENGRRKREDFEERDRLKELEQIQRKIDSVEIKMPQFEKPNQV